MTGTPELDSAAPILIAGYLVTDVTQAGDGSLQVCGSQPSRCPISVTEAPLSSFEHGDQLCPLRAR
jgi:hypothetical protein